MSRLISCTLGGLLAVVLAVAAGCQAGTNSSGEKGETPVAKAGGCCCDGLPSRVSVCPAGTESEGGQPAAEHGVDLHALLPGQVLIATLKR